jgi:hypothetical protein
MAVLTTFGGSDIIRMPDTTFTLSGIIFLHPQQLNRDRGVFV